MYRMWSKAIHDWITFDHRRMLCCGFLDICTLGTLPEGVKPLPAPFTQKRKLVRDVSELLNQAELQCVPVRYCSGYHKWIVVKGLSDVLRWWTLKWLRKSSVWIPECGWGGIVKRWSGRRTTVSLWSGSCLRTPVPGCCWRYLSRCATWNASFCCSSQKNCHLVSWHASFLKI